jgi:recombination protein RecT
MNATRTNKALADCDPSSVISAAMVAATLDLPIDGSLGFSAIVPYKNKGIAVAQFQIMTKGFVQLALRTGQYKTINVGPIFEDEYEDQDIITGEVKLHPVSGGQRDSDDLSKIAGYICYFKLVNGFEITRFWTVKQIMAHGERYSKSFHNEYGLWKTNFPAMASKTVLKNTLSKWGILSTTMQMAMKTDQASFTGDNLDPKYIDSTDSPAEEVDARPPEELVKLAPGTDGKNNTPRVGIDIEETWKCLDTYMLCDDLPAQARKDIQKAQDENQGDPILLAALLNKVKAAYDKRV